MGIFEKARQQKAEGGRVAYAKVGMLGFAGSGKTYTATMFAIGLHQLIAELTGVSKPIGFFDTEDGSDYVEPIFHEHGIELVPYKSRTFDDLMSFTRDCENETDIYLTDSISHIWKEVIESYKVSKKTKYLAMNDWGILKPKWEEFTTLYLTSKLHFFLLGRASWEYEQGIDEDTGKKEINKVGTKMAAETNMGYEPSLLLEMVREQEEKGRAGSMWRHDCYVLKDRTNTINGKVFANPGFDEIRPFIGRLNVGGAHRTVDMSGKTQFESDDWSGPNRKRAQAISSEELEGALTSVFPGQTAKEKKAKVDILETVFETRSWTAIKGMEPMRLREGTEIIKELCALLIKGDEVGDTALAGWLQAHAQDIRAQREVDAAQEAAKGAGVDPDDDIPDFPAPGKE